MNKILKKIMVRLSMMIVLTIPTMTLAEGQITTGTVDANVVETIQDAQDPATNTGTKHFDEMTGVEYVEMIERGDTNVQDLGDRIINKLYDITVWLQDIMYYVSVIALIIGAILIIAGAISRRATIFPGVVACIAACAAYILASHGPEIIVSVANWFTGA